MESKSNSLFRKSMKPNLSIIDWGIGGIGIHKLIKSKLGDVPVLYFSDTGVTPYGMMSRQDLVNRLNHVIAFLRSRGMTHLVIGCNAAGTVLSLLDLEGLEVVSVIESAVRATCRLRPKNLALIGGRRTVRSGVYRRAFAASGFDVVQRVAQPLSGMIENGDTSSTELLNICRRIVAPIRKSSHLLLACTHYPAILPIIKEAVSPETALIDPAEELVKSVERWRLPIGGTDCFLTSGSSEKMKQAARNAFGVELGTVNKIRV